MEDNKRIVFVTNGFLYSGESIKSNIRSNLEEPHTTHRCETITSSLKKKNCYMYLSQVLVYNFRTGFLEFRPDLNLSPKEVLFTYGVDKLFETNPDKKILHNLTNAGIEKNLENESELILDIGDFKVKGLVKRVSDIAFIQDNPKFVVLHSSKILCGSPMPYKSTAGIFNIGNSKYSITNISGGFFKDKPGDFTNFFNLGDDTLLFNTEKVRSYEIITNSQ